MRPRHPHAAESGVGEHTARESEAPNSVPTGKSAWRTPTPKFGPGTARFRGLTFFRRSRLHMRYEGQAVVSGPLAPSRSGTR